MKPRYPFLECEHCKDLSDCPSPDIEDLGTCFNPMPPNSCERPMEVMKATYKKYKKSKQ